MVIAALVGAAATLLTSMVILFPLYLFEILRIPNFLPWPVLVAMVVAVGCNVVMIMGLSVYVTQRVAGPAFSMIKHFRQVEQGVLGVAMQVRADDELKHVVRNYNEMLEGLRRMTREDLVRVQAILEQARALPPEGGGSSTGRGALLRIASELGEVLERRLKGGPGDRSSGVNG